MNVKNLVRNASLVKGTLKELPDGRIVTSKGCKIHIPTRYTDRGVCIIDEHISILGIYAIIVDDKYYGVSMADCMLRIQPSTVRTVMIGEVEYYEFLFNAGATVISNKASLVDDTYFTCN